MTQTLKAVTGEGKLPRVIIGLAKLNLALKQEAYLVDCLAKGRTWFVSRRESISSGYYMSKKRTIQASGETRENVIRCFKGWQGPYAPSIFHIVDDRVLWDKE